ncbi:bifunctional pyr operon transcriptional regulator/uracil phosphoribosyltransferase PyrR [Atopobacter phocae]|uniref:bifunctional pyr operon transcriptional regulator/uracil phosphoribosyltransferase PyrR n=1 Tax=Atopobacter phocae TaxID=136492 RepID=UPI00046F1258|nr:bifunctional pyr operon transcriptional regulator/uracil phosphoribosyltransferase PyrR [Atopobacter phocae]
MIQLLDESTINRTLTRIAYEILEKNNGAESITLVGIKTRGEFIARRIQERIKKIEGKDVPLIVLDPSFYRDDRIDQSIEPPVISAEASRLVNNHRVILVDDVLFTGRTIRAAMDALIDYGRPEKIWLATLIDRGHRELPIRPDFIGKNIPTAKNEHVQVELIETDTTDQVTLIK